MKVAYLDCASGISGDMTLGALIDAGVDLAEIQRGIDSLGLPDCRIAAEEVRRKGFRATNVTVHHPPEHAHRHLHHIIEMIDGSVLSERQKDLARKIFTRLGEAEAKVHGTTIEKVHFHEVGAVDSIADIVGSAIGWDLLGVDRVECSAIPPGSGNIEIAHGRCSVPAPATAELLKGIPLIASPVEAELTTPTGAAIVATIVDRFGTLPALSVQAIGCGAGDRDFDEQANILRLIVGEVAAQVAEQQVVVLETNLDDASGELIGHAAELLLEGGALDVYTTSIQMKKNRPGTMLSVICAPADAGRLEEILFRETTTLGVRRQLLSRSCLPRSAQTVRTAWGEVVVKRVELPDGSLRCAPEYESCRQVAQRNNVAMQDVMEAARRAGIPQDDE